MNRFRFIHFSSMPAFDQGRPVAAVVMLGDEVRVVKASTMPHSDCIGGKTIGAVLRMGLEAMAGTSFNVLPQGVGPLFRLGEAQSLPKGVDVSGLQAWVDAVAFRSLPQNTDGNEPTTERAPRRAAIGAAFFKTHRIAHIVRPLFSPTRHAEWLAGGPCLCGAMPRCHFAPGDGGEHDPLFGWCRFCGAFC